MRGGCNCSTRYRPPGGPGPGQGAIKFWEVGAAIGWNAVARGLTLAHQQSPMAGQRIFAYLNLAVHNAVAAADKGEGHPSPQAAVARAAVTVLGFFFPTELAGLEQQRAAQQSGPHWPGERHTDFAAGEAIGRTIGQQVIASAQTDHFDANFLGPYPTGPRLWTPTLPLTSVVLPALKEMRPFFLTSADQFRPSPPPAFGSPEFEAALNEVRDIAANRTPEQATTRPDHPALRDGHIGHLRPLEPGGLRPDRVAPPG